MESIELTIEEFSGVVSRLPNIDGYFNYNTAPTVNIHFFRFRGIPLNFVEKEDCLPVEEVCVPFVADVTTKLEPFWVPKIQITIKGVNQ